MIVYKLDSEQERDSSVAINDMAAVLAEIAPTFRILEELLSKHEASLSTPSINRFRKDLQNMLPEAIHMAHLISTNSQILAGVSQQASKQLAAVEANAKSSMIGTSEPVKESTNRPVRRVEGTTAPRNNTESRNYKLFQRQNQTNLV
jgi:hypothetical protein